MFVLFDELIYIHTLYKGFKVVMKRKLTKAPTPLNDKSFHNETKTWFAGFRILYFSI